MDISIEQLVETFMNSVTIRAKTAFMLTLGEKIIGVLKDNPDIFPLARNTLDSSWLWEESLSVSPREIFQYLDATEIDYFNSEKLSLICKFDSKTPEPTLTAIMTIINAGCLSVKYAYETIKEICPFDIIDETHEQDAIPGVIEEILENRLIDEAWLKKAMSYLMLNYGSNDPNALGEPIERDELMSLA
jgi:Immunity protein Imm6